MDSSSFIGLVNNAALLLALTLLYDMLVVQSRIEKSILHQIFTGFILSAIGIAIMLNPWNFGQGVLFDTRSVLLSISGLFFGTIPVILAVLSTSFFRLFSGGSGAWTGVGVIVTSGCLGLGWRYFYRNSKENFSMGQLYLLGSVTHVAMLAWMLSLPWEIAIGVLSKITLPVMLIYPLLTVILGKLMINRKKHKKVEEKRRIFFEMLQNSDHIAVFKDTALRYLMINQAYSRLTGHSLEKTIGNTDQELFQGQSTPEQIAMYMENDRQALALPRGESITADEYTLGPGGNTIAYLTKKFPVHGKDGTLLGVGTIATDITKRKRAEENLNLAHEKLLVVLDSIDSTVYVADMKTYEILFMNKKMITDFGGDKTGEKCFKAFREKTDPCDFCTNNQLIDANGNPAQICTWHDQNPITGKIYINHDRAIEWIDGRLVRLQSATDITDLKKMEAQLAQAQKIESVGRLAGGVAHDFNNMLGVILGYTELALEQTEENHTLYSELKEIQRAAQRSADLTKQLLTFARKQIIEPKILNLNESIKLMTTMLHRLIGEEIDLIWKPARDLWPVKMDPSQIDQILANLCVNARDAITGVGKLTIETGMNSFDEDYCRTHTGFIPGDFILLAVSDNGSGMDRETLKNIFEPFFTTKDVDKGTGLGLATVYGIVTQNQGFINVYSEPGLGTTFRIYLPRWVSTGEEPKIAFLEKPSPRGNEIILLVEDEPMILKMAGMMLERQGYTVLSAATPAEAMALAQSHPSHIHLLMTDVIMPEMNGHDLAKHLTSIYPDLKLLFMSGYTANVIANQGVLDQDVHFIQKPFSMKELAGKVRGILDANKINK